jgi:transcriptional regulator with XRE-family HTH domain
MRRPHLPRPKIDHTNVTATATKAAGAPTDVVEVFYRRLDEIIEYQGISQRELARRLELIRIEGGHPEVLGMSEASVGRWFSGRDPEGPSMIFLGFLAEYLKTTIAALLDPSIPVYALPRRHRRPKV